MKQSISYLGNPMKIPVFWRPIFVYSRYFTYFENFIELTVLSLVIFSLLPYQVCTTALHLTAVDCKALHCTALNCTALQ